MKLSSVQHNLASVGLSFWSLEPRGLFLTYLNTVRFWEKKLPQQSLRHQGIETPLQSTSL